MQRADNISPHVMPAIWVLLGYFVNFALSRIVLMVGVPFRGAVKENVLHSIKRSDFPWQQAAVGKWLLFVSSPLYTFWPVLLSFPGVRHGWTLQATLMLILFSALQVLPKLTLALCILCEWPSSSRILLFPHFFLFYVPGLLPSFTSSSVFCPCFPASAG